MKHEIILTLNNILEPMLLVRQPGHKINIAIP